MALKLKSVIFDMDGVITDTMPIHFRSWKIIFANAGVIVRHEDIYKREGQKGIESVREIFSEKGIVYEPSVGLQLLKDKEKLFKTTFKKRFITGSRSFIKSLHKQGIRLALVTGSSREEALKLMPPHIWACFDVTVCGCDVQNGKPHPEPYLTALKQLNIQPRDAVVIENAPFGIRSAKAAGLTCYGLVTSLPKAYLHQADHVFDSFKELATHLNK